MTVGEVRKICDGEPIQLIGSRTGKKLANSWNNVTEVLARVVKLLNNLFMTLRI